jgi:hypothetical protein
MQARGHLRLLRVAAHHLATGDVLELDDPLGGKDSHSVIGQDSPDLGEETSRHSRLGAQGKRRLSRGLPISSLLGESRGLIRATPGFGQVCPAFSQCVQLLEPRISSFTTHRTTHASWRGDGITEKAFELQDVRRCVTRE